MPTLLNLCPCDLFIVITNAMETGNCRLLILEGKFDLLSQRLLRGTNGSSLLLLSLSNIP